VRVILTIPQIFTSIPVLHNMSSPPRTTIPSVQRAVWGRATLFSLGHALACNGLLPRRAKARGPLLGSEALHQRASARWKDDLTALLEEASSAGLLDLQRLALPVGACAPSGVLIGWQPPLTDEASETLVPCADIALTVAVLERRVGNLYLSSRTPDRSWQQLFAQPLAVDDPRFLGTHWRLPS